MYGPGFGTGSLIQRYGVRAVCAAGGVCSAVAVVFALNAKAASAYEGSIALWYLCMILIGVGWNFSFTGATVWLTSKTVGVTDFTKTEIQSANDSLMFLFAGVWIFSAGYIYDAGGGALEGWNTLNFVVVGLIGLYVIVMSTDYYLEMKEAASGDAIRSEAEIESSGDEEVAASGEKEPVHEVSRETTASNQSIEIDLGEATDGTTSNASSPGRSIATGPFRNVE